MKFEKIYARDIIAVLTLAGIFILLAMGHNGWLQGIGTAIIVYYFSKRIYEENHEEILMTK